jgi:hypothetical protein
MKKGMMEIGKLMEIDGDWGRLIEIGRDLGVSL